MMLEHLHPSPLFRFTARTSTAHLDRLRPAGHFTTPFRMASSQPPNQRPVINLLRGWPATSLLPAEALEKASIKALRNPSIHTPSSALLYGPDPGFQPLRESLARWLSEFYGTTTDPNSIAITGGASQSVACILQSFTDPSYTEAVWMVAPCYFLACPIFEDSGFGEGRMRAVPEDEEGINLEFLKRRLEECELARQSLYSKGEGPKPLYKDPSPFRKIYRHIIYCVPSFSNPSGKTMSLRRREGLVKLARQYDALVICDDVYDMLQWHTTSSPSSTPDLSRTLLPRLLDIDLPLGRSTFDPLGQHFGHVVSNGSFSKLVGPGMRTGWTESTPDFALGISKTGSTRSGGAASQFSAAVLTEMLESGDVDAHIGKVLRPSYARRHAMLMDAIMKELVPLGARVRQSSLEEDSKEGVFGGYFVWISFREGLDAGTVAKRCQDEEGLTIAPGSIFEVHGDEKAARFEKDIRLCFAWEEEQNLVEGVERLARVVRRMRDEPDECAVAPSKASARDTDEFK